MGKYGTTGKSGIVAPGLHISMPYDCNGKVFVEVRDTEFGLVWERVEKGKAIKEGMKIIECSMCSNPAVSLDHHYPYFTDMCRCEDHYGKD